MKSEWHVERWDTCEIALEAEGSYANPFTDMDVTATFVHKETARSVTVNGFFDGGPVWRLRFMPTELGDWSYVTESQDPGLDRQEGTITCVPSTKPYLHGPLKLEGHHFRHADGTRRFLFSTRLSCHFASPSIWPRVIRFLREHRINRVFFVMGGVWGSIRELYGPGPDYSRYNLVKFQAIDRVIDALRQADIVASPYFYYFNDGDQRYMTPEQDCAYLRYGMARFGAYANVLPVLSNEVEGKYTDRHLQYRLASHGWANEMGEYLVEQAVFGVPVTVHNPFEAENATEPSYYTLLKDWPFPWARPMLRQAQLTALGAAREIGDTTSEKKNPTYNARSFARHNQLLIDLRRFGIPVVNEEPGYELGSLTWDGKRIDPRAANTQTSESLVPTFWTAVCAGAYTMWGSPATYWLDDPYEGMRRCATPKYIRILHDFVTSLPYWEMAPLNEAVSPAEMLIDGVAYRTNFCLAKPGEAYLVFSLNGGSVAITLDEGTYEATQLDPRTGEQTRLRDAPGGSQEVAVAGREQVVLFRRQA